MMHLKRIISWLTRLLRNRSQAERNVIIQNNIQVNQKIVVVVEHHNEKQFPNQ